MSYHVTINHQYSPDMLCPPLLKRETKRFAVGGKYVKTNFLGRFFFVQLLRVVIFIGHFSQPQIFLLLLWFFTPDFGFWDWGILERLSDCSSYFLLVTEWINITKRHKLTLIVVLSCCRRCTDCHKYVTVCISSVAEHISIIMMIMRRTMMTMTKIMIVVLNTTDDHWMQKTFQVVQAHFASRL